MLNLRRRLTKLERMPSFQRLATPRDPIFALALRQISDEDLKLLIAVTSE